MIRDFDRGLPMEDLALNGPKGIFNAMVNMPFRFNPAEQIYWRNIADGPLKSSEWDTVVASSQQKDQVMRFGHRYLTYARRVINAEKGETPDSELRLIQAGNVLRNLVWENGPHIVGAVNAAEILMEYGKPLLAREAGAGVIKNAAYYKGLHIPRVVEIAITDLTCPSVRMTDECVRAIQYASHHSRSLMQTDGVKTFLEKEIKNENEVIAKYSADTFLQIFGNDRSS